MNKALFTALLVVVFTATASAQPAGDKARAQVLLREGNELLAKQQYAPALAKFQAAYDAYPSPALLLNIGTSLRALGRKAEAANTYARWIQARANPQRLAEVEEVLKELDKKVARVELAVSEPGARVAVDGKPIEAGTRIVRLEPGAHTITAEKQGFKSARSELQLVAGSSQKVPLTLEREATATTEPEPPAHTNPVASDPDTTTTRSSGSSGTVFKIAGISSAAVGLVALGVGIKYGLDAKDINNELESVDSTGAWTPELIARQDEGKSAETKFIVFTAIGGAAIIAGGVLSYIGFLGGDDETDSLALTPSIGPDSAGWAVSGRF